MLNRIILIFLLTNALSIQADTIFDQSRNIINPYIGKHYGVVNDTHVNFRSEPKLESKIIDQLNPSDAVFILDFQNEPCEIGKYTNYWLKIRYRDETGWIYGEFVETIDNISFSDILSDTSFNNNPIKVFQSESGKYYISVAEHYIFQGTSSGIDKYKYEISYWLFDNLEDVNDPFSEPLLEFTKLVYNGEDLLSFGADGVYSYLYIFLRPTSDSEVQIEYEEKISLKKKDSAPFLFKEEKSINLNSDLIYHGFINFSRIK